MPLTAADRRGLRAIANGFQAAQPGVAAWQVATTFVPLLLMMTVMHWGMAGGWWAALLLAPVAALFTVRVFALQHDCGHGWLFRLRRANDTLGNLCSLLTFTPYAHWRRQHAGHHALWDEAAMRMVTFADARRRAA